MLLRKILFPIVPVYYLITWLRNKLYDLKIFESKSYNLPVICVGNLSVGGTGKTPMIEYLLRMLKDEVPLATLSRGYKRQSTGFVLAKQNTKVEELGDEPFQFYSKYKDILVAVDEDRQHGIEELMKNDNPPEVILLDDAYQHRRVIPGFSILLTTYSKLYVDDILLPTGDLREPRNGSGRADVVVVTKCPTKINDIEKDRIRKKLNLKDYQHLFFSSIVYDNSLLNDEKQISIADLKNIEFQLVTGIANPQPIVNYLKSKGLNFNHINFKDHHNFTDKDLEKLRKKDLIITTEKDFVRLKLKLSESELFYLPIKIEIDNPDEYNKLIMDFVINF